MTKRKHRSVRTDGLIGDALLAVHASNAGKKEQADVIWKQVIKEIADNHKRRMKNDRIYQKMYQTIPLELRTYYEETLQEA